MVESRVEFEVESITCDNYEWLVSYREAADKFSADLLRGMFRNYIA